MSEKNIDKKIMTYGSATLILSLFAIVLRTVCLYTSFDAYIGYYKEGFLTTVLRAFCVASAIFFVSAFFRVKDDTPFASGREQPRILGIVGIVTCCVLLLASLMSFSGSLIVPDAKWGIVIAVLGILGGAYFLLQAMGASRALYAPFGFAIIVYCVLVVFVSYFDLYELMNGPNKVTMHMSYIASTLFILAEIRASLSEIKKGFYLASLCAATFFCGVASVPVLIFYTSSGIDNRYIWAHVVLLGFFLYFVARLICVVLNSREREIAEVLDTDAESDGATENVTDSAEDEV